MFDKKHKLMEIMGFSEKKSRIYLGLLESGEITVTDLAKRVGLKRTTVYNLLPELRQEGLIKSTKQNGRQYFYVEDTRDLERLIQEKVSGIKDLVPELKIHHNIISSKPKIVLYEGIGGMKQLYRGIVDDVFQGEDILTYIGLNNFDEFVPEEVLAENVNARIAKRIKNKIIASPGIIAKEWEENANKELREIKILKESKNLFSADMKIYADKVALLSYKENFFGVVIESQEISGLLRNVFEQLWTSV